MRAKRHGVTKDADDPIERDTDVRDDGLTEWTTVERWLLASARLDRATVRTIDRALRAGLGFLARGPRK